MCAHFTNDATDIADFPGGWKMRSPSTDLDMDGTAVSCNEYYMKCYLLIEHTVHLWRCLVWRVKLLRFHQCINIDSNVHIADAQYCPNVLLNVRRRLDQVGVTLTVLHPTERPRAQIQVVKQ